MGICHNAVEDSLFYAMPAPNGNITAIIGTDQGEAGIHGNISGSGHSWDVSNSQRRASTRSSSCALEKSVAVLVIASASVV